MTKITTFSITLGCILLGAFGVSAGNLPPIQTVFIILMENEDWSNVQNNTFAPYMNGVLLPMCSYCSQYYNPPGLHPSLPNYLWLEAGTNFGVLNDNPPSVNHQPSTNHLVTLLQNAGISWKAYAEDITAGYVPLADTNLFAVRHCPVLYFDDVTGTNNSAWPYGIAHVRPYSELAGDLASNNVARYNFISPNVCDDGHTVTPPLNNEIAQGDNWLAAEIPMITNSAAFQNNGLIIITWDENEYDTQPVGLMAISPLAKGGGYISTNHYTHSSTLRTLQEIFGVGPLLGDAANAPDLSDLFLAPLTPPPPGNWNPPPATGLTVASCSKSPGGAAQLAITGAIAGTTNLVQTSTDLVNWATIATNIAFTNGFNFTDTNAMNCAQRYYRVIQLP